MPAWYQQALTPPLVVEANLRIGVIPGEDHTQFLAEVKDPMTGILIAQWSQPSGTCRLLRHDAERAARQLVRLLEEHVGPFDV